MWAAHLAPEDLQLVAEDHHRDVPCQIVGGASDQLEQPAQQQVHEREEHGRNLQEPEARSYELAG